MGPWIGIAIGFLIGFISGAVFLLLLKTANRLSEKGGTIIITFTAELLAIPALWFGGGFLTGPVIQKLSSQLPEGELFMYYVLSLAVVFCFFAAYPAARWIIHLGEELGSRPV